MYQERFPQRVDDGTADDGGQQAAERDAQARERLAGAEAAATRMVAEAARDGGEAALRYFVAQKYVEAFSAMAASPASRLVVVPMEATAMAGGIAQAMELLRAPAAAAVAHAATSVPSTGA